jgi:hypothetical protein
MSYNYLVRLKLQIGEYEKGSDMIINADNEEQAGQMAMALECHGNAHWGEHSGIVYDLGGEFAYSVKGTQELTEDDFQVLKRFVPVFTYDTAQIEELVS